MEPSADRKHPSVGWMLGVSALLFAAVSLLGASTATGVDNEAIPTAKLSQASKSMILQVRTSREVNLLKLDRHPDFLSGAARYLCLEIGRTAAGASSRLCVGGKNGRFRQLGISQTTAAGRVTSRTTIPARVKRSGKYKLVVSFDPARAKLSPDRYRWRVALSEGRCAEDGDESCLGTYPATGRLSYRVREVRAVGCTGGNGQMILHGPRHGKRVALTFDDGPGPDTASVLRELRRFKVKATFFMLGMQVNAYPQLARKVLAAGHEVANHSSVHALGPGYGDISAATRAIKRKTGFRPCLFRPPYGATSASLNAAVKRDKMKIVIWDVDTVDWSQPGSGTIQSRITGGVRPGSIVLMHDAGGPRGQTVAALPGAIRNLKRRGYRFVTVSELLGSRTIYRPVG